MREVLDGIIDEVAGPEDLRVDLDPGQAGSHLVERRLDPPRHLERISPRELLDDEEQARAVVDHGVASQRLVVDEHLGHVAEHDRLPSALLDDHLGHVLGRDDRQDVADGELLIGSLHRPPGADHRSVRVLQQTRVERVRGGRHDFVERHMKLPEPLRDDLDVHLLQLFAQIATLATPGTRSKRARIFQ